MNQFYLSNNTLTVYDMSFLEENIEPEEIGSDLLEVQLYLYLLHYNFQKKKITLKFNLIQTFKHYKHFITFD